MSRLVTVIINSETDSIRSGLPAIIGVALPLVAATLFAIGRSYMWTYHAQYGVQQLDFDFSFYDSLLFGFGVFADVIFLALFVSFFLLLALAVLALGSHKIDEWQQKKYGQVATKAPTTVNSLAKLAAITLILATGVVAPFALSMNTASDRAQSRAHHEMAAFQEWDKPQFDKLKMSYSVIDKEKKGGANIRYCGFIVQTSPQLAVLFDGTATRKIILDESVIDYSTYSMGSQFEAVKKIAACECGMSIPGITCARPTSGTPTKSANGAGS